MICPLPCTRRTLRPSSSPYTPGLRRPTRLASGSCGRHQCSRIRILRFFKFKKRDFLRFCFCFVAYVLSNNDRQCLLDLEVYQIASLHCAL